MSRQSSTCGHDVAEDVPLVITWVLLPYFPCKVNSLPGREVMLKRTLLANTHPLTPTPRPIQVMMHVMRVLTDAFGKHFEIWIKMNKE